MSIRNATTLARSAYDFMASWPFQKGYTDGRTGQPLAYEAFSGTRDQTRYERGRQFARFRGVTVMDRQAGAAPVEAGRRDRPGRPPRA